MGRKSHHIVPVSDQTKRTIRAWMVLLGIRSWQEHITFGPDFMRLDSFSFDLLRREQAPGEELEDTALRIAKRDFAEATDVGE